MREELLLSEQVGLLFFQNVVCNFGILISVVYNRDPVLTSDSCQSLWKLLASHEIAISAYYTQVDGQIECINYTKSFEHICLMKTNSTGLTM